MNKIKYLILAVIICLTFSNCRKSSNPFTPNEANLITLYMPDKTTNSSISLKWSKISDTTFVEYRLNKKYNLAFDRQLREEST